MPNSDYPNIYNISDGTEVALPIRYTRGSNLVATFLTDLKPAAQLLEGTGLQAVPQEDGQAVVLLLVYEYQSTDLRPYNEVGLAIMAVSPKDPVPGVYITDLPVTQDHTNRAGREIWGFPKFVTEIDITQEGKKFGVVVGNSESGQICSMEGTRGASLPVLPSDIFTLTILDGTVLRERVQIRFPSHLSSGEDFLLTVGDSSHQMASNLRLLGLDGATPLMVQYSPVFQSLLFEGVPVPV